MTSSNMFLAVTVLSIHVALLGKPAHAYLDPGTGSMMVQALIGTVAGAFAVAGLYWRKIKDFFRFGATPRDSRDTDPDRQ